MNRLHSRIVKTTTAVLVSVSVTAVLAFSNTVPAQSTDEEIRQGLRSERLVVRWLTLAEMEKYGPYSREMVPLLLERVEQESGVRRQLAVTVLGKIGPDAVEAVPVLTRLAEQGDLDAVRALGGIGPLATSSVATLEKLLAGAPATERLSAAAALWRIDQRPESMRMIENAVRKRPTGCSRFFLVRLIADLGPAGKHLVVE